MSVTLKANGILLERGATQSFDIMWLRVKGNVLRAWASFVVEGWCLKVERHVWRFLGTFPIAHTTQGH